MSILHLNLLLGCFQYHNKLVDIHLSLLIFLLQLEYSKSIRPKNPSFLFRDILRGILANVDCSRCNGRSCRAVHIALGRHGKAGGEAYGVIDLVLLLAAHLVIAAVVVILGAYALCAVVRAVLQIAERERSCAEAVLSRIRFACNDRAREVGVLFDVDVEAVFSSEDAGLSSGLL